MGYTQTATPSLPPFPALRKPVPSAGNRFLLPAPPIIPRAMSLPAIPASPLMRMMTILLPVRMIMAPVLRKHGIRFILIVMVVTRPNVLRLVFLVQHVRSPLHTRGKVFPSVPLPSAKVLPAEIILIHVIQTVRYMGLIVVAAMAVIITLIFGHVNKLATTPPFGGGFLWGFLISARSRKARI